MRNEITKGARIHKSAMLEAPVRVFRGAKIREGCAVGQFTFLNSATTLFPGTRVGRYCSIGRGCEIGAPSHPVERLSTSPVAYDAQRIFPGAENLFPQVRYTSYRPTIIGNDVWIGSNVLILGGVTIGSGAVIGGGAVVVADIAPYTIVGGVPARLIRHRFDDYTIQRLLESRWWDFPSEVVATFDFAEVEKALNQIEALRVREMS